MKKRKKKMVEKSFGKLKHISIDDKEGTEGKEKRKQGHKKILGANSFSLKI